MRLNRLLLAAALAAALPPAPGAAQSGKTIWKPPIAVGTNVSVWRGERIQINLRGFHGNNPVEYTIDRNPRHGSLSPITQPDPDRVARSTDGSLVYAHDNSQDSGADEFTFRARGLRGGLSAPAAVRITVMDRPPVLAAPSVLDFTAAAGEVMTRSLGLTNAGGGVLELECRAKPPFEILGGEFIELDRGQATNILVRYAPTTVGQIDRQGIRLGVNDSTGAQITLRGESFAPFEVSAPANDFVLADQARKATVVLQSRGSEAQEVTITIEPAGLIEVDSPVSLPPGGSVDIPLVIPAERKGERQEVTAIFSTASHRQDILLIAPPIPPALAVQTDTLDFMDARAELVITNSGGVRGSFRINPVAGLAFEEGGILDAREFEVEPGNVKTIALRLDLAQSQEPPTQLNVDLGIGEPQRIPILAPAPTPTPEPSPSVPRPSPPPPQVAKPWKLNRDIRWTESAETPNTIEWKTTKQGWREPRLEIVNDGSVTPYEPPAPPRGWMDQIGDTISGWFSSLVPRQPQPTGEEEAPVPQEWKSETLDGTAAQDTSRRWVLTAFKENSGAREPVSDVFHLDSANRTLKADAEPLPVPTPVAKATPATPTSAPTTGTRRITPALKLEDARANAERDTATVRIIFPRDAEANSYRLEHGFNPTLLDPVTKLPYPGDFQPVPHPATVQIQGTSDLEHEGKKLTVLYASIEGLTPGTSTTWRAVTMADGKDRWPTGEFIVTTLPPWRFPWRNAFLVAAFIGLAVVLYLRWRLNRRPH